MTEVANHQAASQAGNVSGVRYITPDLIRRVTGQDNTSLITELNLSSINEAKKKIKFVEHLEALKSLRKLNISHNIIERVDKLEKLRTHLVSVNLSHNLLSSFDGLESLAQLSSLNVSHNAITEIPNWLPKKLKCLQNLNVSANQIKYLSDIAKLWPLTDLTKLIVAQNPLCKSSHFRLFIVFRLKSLESLDSEDIRSEERSDANQRFQQTEIARLESALETKTANFNEISVNYENLQNKHKISEQIQKEFCQKQRKNIRTIQTLQEELNAKNEILKQKSEELNRANHRQFEMEQEIAFLKIDAKFDVFGTQRDDPLNATDQLSAGKSVAARRVRVDFAMNNTDMQKSNSLPRQSANSTNQTILHNWQHEHDNKRLADSTHCRIVDTSLCYNSSSSNQKAGDGDDERQQRGGHENIKAVQQQNAQLQALASQLSLELETKNKKIVQANKHLESVNNQISTKSEHLSRLTAQIDEMEEDRRRLSLELERLSSQLTKNKQQQKTQNRHYQFKDVAVQTTNSGGESDGDNNLAENGTKLTEAELLRQMGEIKDLTRDVAVMRLQQQNIDDEIESQLAHIDQLRLEINQQQQQPFYPSSSSPSSFSFSFQSRMLSRQLSEKQFQLKRNEHLRANLHAKMEQMQQRIRDLMHSTQSSTKKHNKHTQQQRQNNSNHQKQLGNQQLDDQLEQQRREQLDEIMRGLTDYLDAANVKTRGSMRQFTELKEERDALLDSTSRLQAQIVSDKQRISELENAQHRVETLTEKRDALNASLGQKSQRKIDQLRSALDREKCAATQMESSLLEDLQQSNNQIDQMELEAAKFAEKAEQLQDCIDQLKDKLRAKRDRLSQLERDNNMRAQQATLKLKQNIIGRMEMLAEGFESGQLAPDQDFSVATLELNDYDEDNEEEYQNNIINDDDEDSDDKSLEQFEADDYHHHYQHISSRIKSGGAKRGGHEINIALCELIKAVQRAVWQFFQDQHELAASNTNATTTAPRRSRSRRKGSGEDDSRSLREVTPPHPQQDGFEQNGGNRPPISPSPQHTQLLKHSAMLARPLQMPSNLMHSQSIEGHHSTNLSSPANQDFPAREAGTAPVIGGGAAAVTSEEEILYRQSDRPHHTPDSFFSNQYTHNHHHAQQPPPPQFDSAVEMSNGMPPLLVNRASSSLANNNDDHHHHHPLANHFAEQQQYHQQQQFEFDRADEMDSLNDANESLSDLEKNMIEVVDELAKSRSQYTDEIDELRHRVSSFQQNLDAFFNKVNEKKGKNKTRANNLILNNNKNNNILNNHHHQLHANQVN